MQVIVNCQNENKCFQISNTESFSELLSKVQEAFEINGELSLYDNTKKIECISEISSSNLFAAVEVIGGGKKRGGKKRKPHTTPKKNKHKHSNVKLMALSYYAISKDNKVERTKNLCESSSCKGKGIFMANHWNRHYCGRCHAVLIKKNAPKEEPKRKPKAAPVAATEAPVAAKPAKGKKK